jgi:glyoxylase-like metal-dependent hydrolase (beta-lactamase superfamily II)
VIISHWHPDHWGGLQVFAGCPILATQATRQAMLPIIREMLSDKQDPSRIEKELQAIEERLTGENNPPQHESLQITIARLRHDLQALPTLNPTLPNQIFEGKIIFHGTARTVELIPVGKAHTESDCVLQLPKDKIAFIGDIGFFHSQPFMAYGFPVEWIALLNSLMNGRARTFVPGHGPVGHKVDLRLEAKYIQELEDMVTQVILSGGTLNEALRQTLPPPFDIWQGMGRRFEANVRSSFKRQSHRKA